MDIIDAWSRSVAVASYGLITQFCKPIADIEFNEFLRISKSHYFFYKFKAPLHDCRSMSHEVFDCTWDRQTDWLEERVTRVLFSSATNLYSAWCIKDQVDSVETLFRQTERGGVKETREGRGTGRGHKWKLVKARCRVWRSYNYDVIWGEMWTYVNSDPQLFEYRWTIA